MKPQVALKWVTHYWFLWDLKCCQNVILWAVCLISLWIKINNLWHLWLFYGHKCAEEKFMKLKNESKILHNLNVNYSFPPQEIRTYFRLSSLFATTKVLSQIGRNRKKENYKLFSDWLLDLYNDIRNYIF
jgi:hypothetical protein